MSDGWDALLNAPVVFGLKAQGHLPTIGKMLGQGKTWEEIGKAINWCPDTAREHYERYWRENPIKVMTTAEAVELHLPEVYKTLTTKYAGWKYHGPYTPGKAGHHTFLLTKGEEKLWVHFNDTDFGAIEQSPEELKNERAKGTHPGC